MSAGEGDPTDRRALPQTWNGPLRVLLAAHVVVLLVLALGRDVALLPALALLSVPLALSASAGSATPPRRHPSLLALGLAWCSVLLVAWTGGAVEAWLHGLLVIGVVGLARDRTAIALATAPLAVLHPLVAAVPDLLHDAPPDPRTVPLWGVLGAAAVLAAAGAVLASWTLSRELESDVAQTAAVRERDEGKARRQQELAAVYATVARRSQGLLERQLHVIERLESDEKDPGTLEQLFVLDHLTTRMNREAASMLVLGGGEPNRRVTGTPPLSEVARGAIGEIEDYTRVDLALADDRDVEGVVVAALVHLLSELVENAANFSPPDSRVVVAGETTADGGYRIRVMDRGIGLDDSRIHDYNHLLANPPDVAPVDNQRLGLSVVARLAGRHALLVRLAHNPDGIGVTAIVQVPASLLDPAAASVLEGADVAEVADVADVAGTVPAPSPAGRRGRRPAVVEPVAALIPEGASGGPAGEGVMAPSARPRWASATAQAGSSGGAASPVGTPQPPGTTAPVPVPAARPVPTARTTAAHATARSASTWSYAGHLDRRVDTPSEDDADARRRRFGRGTRSQVSGVAPRPDQGPTERTPAAGADGIPLSSSASAGGVGPTASGRGGASAGGTSAGPAGAIAEPAAQGRATTGQSASVRRSQPSPPGTHPPTEDAGQPPTAERRGPRAAAGRAKEVAEPAPSDNAPTTAELLQEIRDAAASSAGRSDPAEGSPEALRAEVAPAPSAVADPAAALDPPSASPAGASDRPPTSPVAPVQDRVRLTVGTELPQRRRGESLPTGLRAGSDAPPRRSASAAPVSREQSRSLLSSYQSRLQAGRKAAGDQVARVHPLQPEPDGGAGTDAAAGSDKPT